MTRFFLLTVAAVLLAAAAASSDSAAAVFSRDWKTPGDGLLTYDDVNQREWLDLTETQLIDFQGPSLDERYEAVVAETLGGGLFEGFVVATSDDVFALAASGGVNAGTVDFAINMTATAALTDLLGDVFSTIGGTSNRNSIGHVANEALTNAASVFFRPNARDVPAAGVRIESISSELNGVWLFRQVPEPSTLAIATGLLFWSFFFCNRLHRRPQLHLFTQRAMRVLPCIKR